MKATMDGPDVHFFIEAISPETGLRLIYEYSDLDGSDKAISRHREIGRVFIRYRVRMKNG